jgi:hypothetical protein
MNINLQLKMITFSAVIVLLVVSLLYLNQSPAGAASLNPDAQSIRLYRISLQKLHEEKQQSTAQSSHNNTIKSYPRNYR